MTRTFDNKFNIGDEVAFNGKMGWITGVDLYLGYDVAMWQYTVSRALYQADNENMEVLCRLKCDIVRSEKVPEDKIMSVKHFAERRQASLQKEIDSMQSKLESLKAERSVMP